MTDFYKSGEMKPDRLSGSKLNLPKALTTPANKIYPDISEVREKAKKQESEEEKRIRLAREAEELRQERKRDNFFRKHSKVPKFGDVEVNHIEGTRVGRKDSKVLPNKPIQPAKGIVHGDYGRICRQDPCGRSDVQAGFNDYSRAFEKAHNKQGKPVRDKPAKAKPAAVREAKRLASMIVFESKG